MLAYGSQSSQLFYPFFRGFQSPAYLIITLGRYNISLTLITTTFYDILFNLYYFLFLFFNRFFEVGSTFRRKWWRPTQIKRVITKFHIQLLQVFIKHRMHFVMTKDEISPLGELKFNTVMDTYHAYAYVEVITALLTIPF